MTNSFSNFATLDWLNDSLNVKASDAQLHAQIDHIKSVGFTGITFSYAVTVSANGTVLNTSPSDRMLTQIDYARSIGLTIETKVHWTQEGFGNLNTWSTPAGFNVNTFLTGVDNYFKAFSPIAQAHGITTQYLGTESDNFMTSQYLSQWRQIVNDIRMSYSGQISYDGNFMGRPTDPFNQIAIWGLVDQIALSFYPTISQTPVTNLSQLISLFKTANPALSNPLNQPGNAPYASIVGEIKALSAQYGKKIFLGEVNYEPIASNLHGYIDTGTLIATNTPVDNNAAILAYQALYNILANNLSGIVTGATLYGYEPWIYVANPSIYASWIPYAELSGTNIEQALSTIFAQQKTGAVLTSTIAYAGDTYSGGLGINTVVYSGSSNTFTLKANGNSYTVSDLTHTKGVDTLANIQRLQFTDTNVALDIGKDQTAGSAYMLYKAAFNRTPDVGGLGFWISKMDTGMGFNTVAQNFVNSTEFQSAYGGSNPLVNTLVTKLYNNVLNRAPDGGGLAFWQDKLTNGGWTVADVLGYFATSNENVANVTPLIANGIPYQQYVG